MAGTVHKIRIETEADLAGLDDAQKHFLGLNDTLEEIKEVSESVSSGVQSVGVAAAETAAKVEDMSDATGEWKPEDDAKRWQDAFASVSGGAAAGGDALGGFARRAEEFAAEAQRGAAAGDILNGVLGAMGKLGPVGLVIGAVVGVIIQLRQEAERVRLEKIKEQADIAVEGVTRLSDVLDEKLGGTLARQQQALEDFLGQFEKTRQSLSRGYSDLQKRIDLETDVEVAKMESRRDAELQSVGENPEAIAQINQSYQEVIASLKELGEQKKVSARLDQSDQSLSGARSAGESARAQAAAEAEAIRAAQADREGAIKGLAAGGIYSDQERAQQNLESLQAEIRFRPNVSDQETKDRAIKLQLAGEAAKAGRAESAAGVVSFDGVDESQLTEMQRVQLQQGVGRIGRAGQQIDAARGRRSDSLDAANQADEALARATMDRRNLDLEITARNGGFAPGLDRVGGQSGAGELGDVGRQADRMKDGFSQAIDAVKESMRSAADAAVSAARTGQEAAREAAAAKAKVEEIEAAVRNALPPPAGGPTP